MKTLFVYFENQRVGKLTRDDELIYHFNYDKTWQTFPLSLSMPLSQREFGNKITLSFFENLLPEGAVKETLERSQNIKGTFDFLEHFGRDCAGAIVVTNDESYQHHIQLDKLEVIDMRKVYAAIKEKQSVVEVIADFDPGYLSLAGAQDKFPAIFKNGKFYLPTKGAPTTHIVKAPIWRKGVKESVFNEYYCMSLAKAVGLNVPNCFIFDGEHPLYVIERYDRFRDKDGFIHRIHQQDFCQAQGFTSEFKYEEKGGPSLKDNYDLIVQNITIKERMSGIHSFIDWVCFNLLLGNNDSHSKNISFVMRDNKIELAPLYDLMCTSIYPELKRNFSFLIGDRDDFSRIGKNQIDLLENQLSINSGTFMERLFEINKKVIATKDSVAESITKNYPEVKIAHRIADHIKDRSKSLKKQKAFG